MAEVRITNHPVVGRVRWRARPDRTIEILDGWADQNIIRVNVPPLRGVPTYGQGPSHSVGSFSGRVSFYRGAADQLQAAWAEVEARGLMDRVLFWDGSFVPRLVRGSARTPSNHTFGTAFDINAAWNGLGVTPPPAGVKGSVRELVPIFEKYGFFWGGNYKQRKDGMHFEVERLLPAGEIQQVSAGVAPTEAPLAVQVFINGVQRIVPALLVENSTWVGARALLGQLGGQIVKAGGDPFTITVNVNGTERALPARNIGGIGYVRFRDINSLYGHSFQYNAEERRLDITTA